MGGGLSDGGGAYPRVVKTVNGEGGLSDGGAYLRRGLIGRILRYFNGPRYVTGLPLKSKDYFMPDNYRLAHKRFLRVVASTLEKDPEHKREYINIFDSYEETI